MSKIAKWRAEKMKVKVVFRLQFHATHIPQTGWDKLFVSFIPADTGKATAKTTKANVRNGTCKWADPIYETTRLLLDEKTKQYDEKLYKLVVAMGSSRSSLLGEANINLADYVDASKPSAVALPLHNCNSGTVLHVTIQLLTSKTGFREFEQQRELREKGLQMTTNHHIHDDPFERLAASAEVANDQMDKVNVRIKFKSESRELPSLEEEVELNEEYADSAVGIDGSSNTSESLYAEKHDTSSPHEVDSLKSTISGDLGGLSLSQSPQPEKGDSSDHRLLQQRNSDWVHGWSSDYSVDNDLATAYEENSRLRESLEVAESSILELKLEVSTLRSQLDEFGVETQNFSEQLATEIASGEKLAKEVSLLKSECSKCKDDFGQLKRSSTSPHFTNGQIVEKDQDHLFQDMRMKWLQGLLVMEDKLREVQNKAYLRYDNSDSRFLYQDVEALQCILQDLKQGITETISVLNLVPAERTDLKDISAMNVQKPEQFIQVERLEGFDADHYHTEGVHHCLSRPSLVNEDLDLINATSMMKKKICELERELEESKADRENLARKLDQMECYYEALIQELEESQKQTLGELQNLRNEHSSCLYTISSCKTQMETMHKDMNEQFLRFAEDRHNLESLNKQLESRAIASESALKRARWNHSIAVVQLQKDLELLSFQVLSMFETNKSLIEQAFTEASQLRCQEYLERVDKGNAPSPQEQYKTRAQESEAVVNVLQKTENELPLDQVIPLQEILTEKNLAIHTDLVADVWRNLDALDSLSCTKDELPGSCTIIESKVDFQESDTPELLLCQNQNSDLNKQFLGRYILLEDFKRLLHLQEERYQKAEAELCEMHVVNMHLDVFSRVIQETLLEACDDIGLMQEKMDEFVQQLEHSAKSKELLMLRLQTALDDVNTLSEYKANSTTKCNDLALQNQMLEEKLINISNESCLLTQKFSEYEDLMKECGSYKSKYLTCTAENTELAKLLKQEALEKTNLQNEVRSMYEELHMVRAEFDKQASMKDNLEKTVKFLQDKLGGLMSSMVSYNEQLYGQALHSKPIQKEMEDKDLISSILLLEEFQKKAYEYILQLTQDKKDMDKERDVARNSIISTEAEILVMKQKFESDIQDMMTKLDLSNAHVEKLQLELEDLANKLKFSSECEEKYAEHNRELFSKIAVLEVELQHVMTENGELIQKLLVLESVKEELEMTKLTVVDVKQKNHALMMSLQAGNEESIKLEIELNCLQENLRCVHDELLSERGAKAEFESTISDLTSRLNEKHDQLLFLDDQKAELVNLKQLVSTLELEKSRVCHLLLHSEECLKKVDENASSLRLQVTDLETHLAEVHEQSLTADIELIFTRNQFQTRMQELVQQLESLDECHEELYVKHHDLLTTLNGHIASEGQCVEENARLLTALESLKSELAASVTEKEVLLDKGKAISAELEKFKTKATSAEVSNIQDKQLHELEVEQLKCMLMNSEKEIDNLRFSRNELEITVIVLRDKLDELRTQISLLMEYSDELMMLRQQNIELAHRLSEQILKTEEIKNLSIHLKEFKDKDDVECIQACGKIDTEELSVNMQESLRIAFIREQCETKLQELRNQLYISKTHGEELLLKLQDALDEVENRKKSEASHMKGNNELSLKILALETELQAILSEKREKIKEYDRMKAELECSLISLDCCKEDKQKLETSLQECIKERLKIAVELSSTKEQLGSCVLNVSSEEEENPGPGIVECISSEQFTKEVKKETPFEGDLGHERDKTVIVSANDPKRNHCLKSLDRDSLLSYKQVEDACPLPSDEHDHSSPQMGLQSMQDGQDGLLDKGVLGSSRKVLVDQQTLLQDNAKNLSYINDHFKAQSLKSSMDLLHKELEKMKNENLASFQQDDHCEPTFQGLQNELLQLHKANEQLGSIFPLFNEFSGSGNALERVLALEIELAEALQTKRKSSIHFQSSFLKQHSDEEAIFKSFRDINELIKDMLELKERYTTVETELKEMHDRYSQLSLQFAEVEGERQKLLMTLKNVRVSKKPAHFNRTSANFEDFS